MTMAKTRPNPTRPAEGAFRQLIRTIGLLERAMQPCFARFGITGGQWGVLRNLYRAEAEGHPALRLTDLSERLLIRPPSVTGVVDRLERARLVARVDSPVDLRVKQVMLTPRGRQLVDRMLAVHAAHVEAVMDVLTPTEQAKLQDLLHRLENHLDGLLEGGGLVAED
ncbi:MAG TPA: MarR family transcriptional regulator [Gemmataceae bacterium]|jgi:DNA-binding MarR family transcriptional regulator|nr:MarR family transcriptional regulator [Gemmataceae bacterium]